MLQVPSGMRDASSTDYGFADGKSTDSEMCYIITCNTCLPLDILIVKLRKGQVYLLVA